MLQDAAGQLRGRCNLERNFSTLAEGEGAGVRLQDYWEVKKGGSKYRLPFDEPSVRLRFL